MSHMVSDSFETYNLQVISNSVKIPIVIMKFALACLLLIGTTVQIARGDDDTTIYEDMKHSMHEAVEWVKESLPSIYLPTIPKPSTPDIDIDLPDVDVDLPDVDVDLPDVDVDRPKVDIDLPTMPSVDDMIDGAKEMGSETGDMINRGIDNAQAAMSD